MGGLPHFLRLWRFVRPADVLFPFPAFPPASQNYDRKKKV
jgi:hypothetical protein